ncbi:zinc-dependent alcohol dehydrogenase family protein [Nocardiopsis sp. RSe5-2]|uniref:Zinc-dependent alcohol dehydrogenase family protein n=1 Tax=Nocardiopsis endophytica TaxID=3018445 RepID=A0ABT4U5Y2_9ACTN|nr:zinc-dependent alcohol dehydrogenase family protein [Nocardiopsis endophytica]MDA2812354.1 zinc-dependent alcohol dehydrogenase family protein [Nocardiopsis endophytica]
MRRAVVTRFGPAAEAVGVEDYTPRPPGEGEVQVRMAAAAVNPSDLVTIAGAYPSRTPLPHIPGFEGVGRVCAVGPGVEGLREGERVLPIGSPGAWQQVKTAEARWCFRPLPELTDEQAALSYINPLTAVRMVRAYAAGPGAGPVAVNAAGSAIGGMLARLLHRRGVRPVALVRGDASRPAVSGPEWAGAVATDRPGWTEELARLTGGGPQAAFDAVGGEEGGRLALSLRSGGRLVHYGLLSGLPLAGDLARRRPDVRIALFRLRDWVHTAPRDEVQDSLDEAGRLVLEGAAASRVQASFPLERVREAVLAAQERGGKGKVLLLP